MPELLAEDQLEKLFPFPVVRIVKLSEVYISSFSALLQNMMRGFVFAQHF